MELRIVSKKSSTISLEQFKKMRNDWREQIALLEIQQISYWKSINNLELAYKNADKNKYVVMTLRDKKMRYKFKTANNVILIGSGMYPYSLFDLHKHSKKSRFSSPGNPKTYSTPSSSRHLINNSAPIIFLFVLRKLIFRII